MVTRSQGLTAAASRMPATGSSGQSTKSKSPNFDTARNELISQVKCAQRQSPSLKDMWHELCDAQGGGIRDPGRHTDDFLHDFLDQVRATDPDISLPSLFTDTEEKRNLVGQVKRSQIANEHWKHQWHEFCDTHGNGIRDPTRHGANFLQQFLSENGIEHEPLPVARSGPPDLSLVEAVKSAQRASADNKNLWHDLCDTECAGVRDPSKLDSGTLRRFLDSLATQAPLPKASPLPPARLAPKTSLPTPAPVGGANNGGSLVEAVKAAQRANVTNKNLWHDFCDTECSGVRDPAKLDRSLLEKFLEYWLQAPLEPTQPAQPTRPVPTTAYGGGVNGGSLVEAVKAAQRASPENKNLWHDFCDTECGGVRDPARHDSSTLTTFLETWLPEVESMSTKPVPTTSGGSQLVTAAPADLIEKVKNAQRASSQWKDLWHAHCDSKGAGVRDPSRHDSAFITMYLQSIGITAEPASVKKRGRPEYDLVIGQSAKRVSR